MLAIVFAIICCGALGVSFMSMLNEPMLDKLFVRFATLGGLALFWFEPVWVSTRYLENQTGLPWFLWLVLMLLFLFPFFYTTAELMFGPLGWTDKLREFLSRKLTRTAGGFPDAEKAEAEQKWDKAFGIYKEKYVAGQYRNPLLWNRILAIMRRWNDPDKCLTQLLELVKAGNKDEMRTECALQSAELLGIGIGSAGRAKKLLQSVLPAIQNNEQRMRIEFKLEALGQAPEGGTHRLPPAA